MSADLSVEFCGIRFKNPFLLGSAPPTRSGHNILEAAKAGWGGAVTWPLGFENIPVLSVYRSVPPSIAGQHDYFGFANTGGAASSKLGDMKWFEKQMKIAKEGGIPVIASILCEEADRMGEMARKREELGADMIEINLSCPFAEAIGLNHKLLKEIIVATKEGCNIPVMVKLPPAIPSMLLIETAKTIKSAGADAISGTNTIMGLMQVDLETGIPEPALVNKKGKPLSLLSGVSGPAIKQISLGTIAQIAKSIDIPLSGIGGVSNWQSAAEYIMVGATTTQSATSPMVQGYKIVRNMIQGLSKFMKRKGYHSIEDFRGKSLKFIGSPSDLNTTQPFKAKVDQKKCTGCTTCVTACFTGGNEAITMQGKRAKVNATVCRGCSLCTLVCPKGAISMVSAQ